MKVVFVVAVMAMLAVVSMGQSTCSATCTTKDALCPNYGVCDGTKCVPNTNLPEGSACGTGGRTCNATLRCVNNKCEKKAAETGTCSVDTDCGPGLMCGKTKKCVPLRFIDDVCYDATSTGGADQTCPRGTSCKQAPSTIFLCTGETTGAVCETNDASANKKLCGKGLYCKYATATSTNGTCASVIANGVGCTKDGVERDSCGPLSVCGASGKCQYWFGASQGEACDSNIQCKYGERCEGGKCVVVDNSTLCSNRANETCGVDPYTLCNCVDNTQKCKVPQHASPNCGTRMLNLVSCLVRNSGATEIDAPYVWRDTDSKGYSCIQQMLLVGCCLKRPDLLSSTVQCPVGDRPGAYFAGLPVFLLVALLSLGIVLDVPQSTCPKVWRAMCGWRWWPEDIEEFNRIHGLDLDEKDE